MTDPDLQDAPEVTGDTATTPPPTPRPAGPAARRRVLAEPHVRFWCISSALLFLTFLGLMVERLWQRSRAMDLLRHGDTVTATITGAEGGREHTGRAYAPGTRVDMEFEYGGQVRHVQGFVDRAQSFIRVGDQVVVHVDPADPGRWSADQDVAPWGETLIGPAMVIPPMLVAIGATLFVRRRMLRLWQTGKAVKAVVVETRPSGLSPMVPTALCVPAETEASELLHVSVPRRMSEGESLWIIVQSESSRSALAAAWFDGTLAS